MNVDMPVAPSGAIALDQWMTTPKKISILGATGSIGDSTLDIVLNHPDLFEVVAITGGQNIRRLVEIANQVKPSFVAIADEAKRDELKDAVAHLGCDVAAGDAGIIEAARQPCDMSISAIVGFAGLQPTLAALESCKVLALANKESLVCAGSYVRQIADASGIPILPLDSEHNAIFQALSSDKLSDVETITITASGGPFRTWAKEEIEKAGPAQALKHPNWSMGSKITIDSATLMNKGLEVIEAHHLFPVRSDQLDVVVHPESIIHGMVSFVDGAVVAELGCPDMRTPIAHCMAHPARIKTGVERLNLAKIGKLTFEAPDYEKFPNLRLALDALEVGDHATNLLNAANEVAVSNFLQNSLPFYGMSSVVSAVLDKGLAEFSDLEGVANYEEALALDEYARAEAQKIAATFS